MEASTPPRRSPQAQTVIYLAALGVYLCAIYLPFLWMPVPDGAWKIAADVASPMQKLVALEQEWIGAASWVWRLQNLSLLYLCSVCVYFLTLRLAGRPLWLASFAAVLFMANPAKGESIYAVLGVVDWLPVALCLSGLALYARWRTGGSAACWAGGTALLGAGTFLSAQPVFVPILFLHLLFGRRKDWLLLMVTLSVLALCLLSSSLGGALRFPTPMSVLLVLYPLGFLPDTEALFTGAPWVEWLVFFLWTGLAWLAYRKISHPALLWGWGGTILIALHWPLAFDRVTMEGAAVLLLPMALVHVGLAAVVQAVWQHPKWRKPMVLLTAFWCVAYFALQVRAGLMWWPVE